jgi:hypothetical protein
MTVIQAISLLLPPPLLSFVVRVRQEVANVAVLWII